MGKEVTPAGLVCLHTDVEIAGVVQRLAWELDRDYQHRQPVLVGILKGSFIFLADLVRQMKTPLQSIEFLRLSSYGSGTVSSGNPEITLELSAAAVAGKNVVIVEDIVDTGITTSTAFNYLSSLQPASVKICTLLDKPSRRQVAAEVSYVGFTVPDEFIVGYGIDFDQKYRQLPHIFRLDQGQVQRRSGSG